MAPVTASEGLDQLGAEPFLAALVRSSDDAIIGKTPNGIVVFWNAAAERLYGYDAVEMLGHDIGILIPGDRSEELADILIQVRQGRVIQGHRTERLRKDGAIVPVSITVSPVVGDDGTIIGASTIARDLSQYDEHLRLLRESERRAAEALSTLETWQSSAPIGLGFVDRDFRFIHLNEMLATMSGSSVPDLIGKTVAEVVPEIWQQVKAVYRKVLENGAPVLNIEVAGKTAADPERLRHWLASYYPVNLEAEIIGVGIVVVDVTERATAEVFRSIAMNNMAEGLFTVDTQGRLTSMNDAAASMLGWAEDELLGQELQHFVLAQEEGNESIESGNRELLTVRSEGRHVRLDDHAYRCKNGSLLPVAISASPLLIGTSIEGAVVVFRDITEERAERIRIKRELAALTWVGRIREALDEDRFILYTQPIVPLTGSPPSEELLLRMVGRDGGIIPPGAFLDVAERYGLITEIDQWVVTQAVRLAAEGRHVGANLSAESMDSLDLLALIAHEMEQARADPSNLVFEITETALMRDMEKGEAFARGVVDLGCCLALDDFGTGFGTFTHVKKLPIKYLKIDIEFVRELVSSSANQHVVKAIVNLAQGFGCQTIAEGVEDEETLKLLQDFGVDYAQGFHLGRPAPLQPLSGNAFTSSER
jgi:PAS domain S-box-containing protein